MPGLPALVQYIDNFTDRLGRALAWLGLAMALVTAVIVVLRYGFSFGSIAAQEAVVYMHGCLFMLGAGYALKHDSHVRVDIFYRGFSDRSKAWVNCVGGIVFLLPLCAFIFGISWSYVAQSWATLESSPEPGGIPAVFLLKSLLPLMALNLMMQGMAEILRGAQLLIESDR